MISWGER